MGKKVIVVTGANKGIGLAIVETLLQQLPEAVVLLGSRDASRGWSAFFLFHRRFLSKMERLLPNAHSLPCSISLVQAEVRPLWILWLGSLDQPWRGG